MSRDLGSIVSPAIVRGEAYAACHRAHVAVQDAERKETRTAEQAAAAKQDADRRRLDLGRSLVALKSATKHGAWLPTLADLGIERTTASRYMALAGYVDASNVAQADTCNISPPSVPSYAEAGIDHRPRAGDADGDNDDDTTEESPTPARGPHVSHNSGNNEWYTPSEYVEPAREVLGIIDLDPASSETANAVVKARRFHSTDDDGLEQGWSGRVWMNPPYASDLVGRFAAKLAHHVDSGEVSAAVVLVNNATETAWFATLIERASAVVFPRGRVRFWEPDGKPGAPLQGQALLYLGPEPKRFIAAYAAIGWGALVQQGE